MRNISFIILTSMLGYKDINKKYLKLDILEKNVININNIFTKPDIIVVTGHYNKSYKKIKYGFRICENQLPFDTGEVEQIRIGLDNAINPEIVILKEDCVFECKKIKELIKRGMDFVLGGENSDNPGMVIQDKLIHNISFGLDNYFGDLAYFKNYLNSVEEFVEDPYNVNKKFHEVVNHIVNMEPLNYYENTYK